MFSYQFSLSLDMNLIGLSPNKPTLIHVIHNLTTLMLQVAFAEGLKSMAQEARGEASEWEDPGLANYQKENYLTRKKIAPSTNWKLELLDSIAQYYLLKTNGISEPKDLQLLTKIANYLGSWNEEEILSTWRIKKGHLFSHHVICCNLHNMITLED